MDMKMQLQHLISEIRISNDSNKEKAFYNLAKFLDTFFAEKDYSQAQLIIQVFNHLNEEVLLENIASSLQPESLYDYLQGLLEHKIESHKAILNSILNFLRRSSLLKSLYHRVDPDQWFYLMLKYIDAANFGIWQLLDQRRIEYGEKTIFQVLQSQNVEKISYDEAINKIELIAAALITAIDKRKPHRIGILAYNSIEMALLDLSCLSLGLANAMIPANSAPSQLEYMVNHSEIDILFIGSEKLYTPVEGVLAKCKKLKRIISLNDFKNNHVEALTDFIENERSDPFSMSEAIKDMDISKPVTVMYTSGTTGHPKGILFSQRQMICKRYARALALPEIGPQDSFLCYLPLFHTFGRYFELQGSIFWGAQYSFVEKPAIEILLKDFSIVKPTVFISIPKKWKQIYETVEEKIDIETAPDPQIKKQLSLVTGGNLRWGLSAAGYLDPDVFRFYQRNGVSLLSGFGMTEGTGGMLMTPPEKYKDNSLGLPLPGIEATLGEDGELLVKGPYVFDQYLNPEKGELPVDEKGWFHSGDIMERDNDGYYTIIDRKKEIYKNIKGQTVSPQKIENLFREFLSVKHVFLAGDHREYNTVLIVPNMDFNEGYLSTLSESELQNFFSSLIVSINRFLAPFERIVNFAIMKKDFDEEKELTPKKTFKRKIIEKNYHDLIESLYQNPWLSLPCGNIELRIPNWFLREKGMTANEFSSHHGVLIHRQSGKELKIVHHATSEAVLIGNYLYHLKGKIIDFDEMLADKSLWIGNWDFVQFFGQDIFHLDKALVYTEKTLQLKAIKNPSFPSKEVISIFTSANGNLDNNVTNLHYALVVALSQTDKINERVFALLEETLRQDYSTNKTYILKIFRFFPDYPDFVISRFVLKCIIYYEEPGRFLHSASGIWVRRHSVWDRQTMIEIAEHGLSEERILQIQNFTKTYFRKILKTIRPDQVARLKTLLEFLTIYTSYHPTLYKMAREIIVHYVVQEDNGEISKFALEYFYEMKQQLRQWMGPVQRIAVDPETGFEYRWEEVIVFDDEIEAELRVKLIRAIKEETVIKESIFIFNRRSLVQLRDIPQGGIWITLLAQTDEYISLRASIQTRSGESFDLKFNLNLNADPDPLVDHQFWMIIAGETEQKPKLVEEFCSSWERHGLWTEEYSSAESVGHLISRQMKRNRHEDLERIKNHWPNSVWSSLVLAIDLWLRTDKKLILKDLSFNNFIVPQADYQIGGRIVSLDYRKANIGEGLLISEFWQQFVVKSMKEFGEILGNIDEFIIPYAIIESCGTVAGKNFLKNAVDQWKNKKERGVPKSIVKACASLIDEKEFKPFYPQKLYFAIERFRRWKLLSANDSPEANAAMLKELYETYRLDLLEKKQPETRIRFFNDTVFNDSSIDLKNELGTILKKINNREVSQDQYIDVLSNIRRINNISNWEEFFLTRLTNPYLSPEDSASFVELEEDGKWKTEVVVNCFDSEGEEYVIRGPVNPKEVGKLYNLFLQTNLPVHFRPEHRFLIALNTRGVVIAGLFYFFKSREAVTMEKIVVKSNFRRKGVSARLMQEFFSRLRNIGVQTVSTGFYRPEFFYKFDFKIENKYEGLVKDLTRKGNLEIGKTNI